MFKHPLIEDPKELKFCKPRVEPVPDLLLLLNPHHLSHCVHPPESFCRFLEPARHHGFLELLVMTLQVCKVLLNEEDILFVVRDPSMITGFIQVLTVPLRCLPKLTLPRDAALQPAR